jgi:hypothetical protein
MEPNSGAVSTPCENPASDCHLISLGRLTIVQSGLSLSAQADSDASASGNAASRGIISNSRRPDNNSSMIDSYLTAVSRAVVLQTRPGPSTCSTPDAACNPPYPVPDVAADGKTLDARVDALAAARKPAGAIVSGRDGGIKPGVHGAPLRGPGTRPATTPGRALRMPLRIYLVRIHQGTFLCRVDTSSTTSMRWLANTNRRGGDGHGGDPRRNFQGQCELQSTIASPLVGSRR